MHQGQKFDQLYFFAFQILKMSKQKRACGAIRSQIDLTQQVDSKA